MKNKTMDPNPTYDAVIVGGGMAGLTATAYISKAGLKVLLCEKEKKIGGLVNSFDYKGFVFDGGIRGIENSGIVHPMLKQLGVELEFLPNGVSLGIGKDVIGVDPKDCLETYQKLLGQYFPDNKSDIAAVVQEIRKVMGYMEILYGIDNPMFMDLTDLKYISRTILPWALKYITTLPKISKLYQPVDEYLSRFSKNQALLDIIDQHFFQKTPAYFALSYFSLYLDYRYPKGGTGSFSQAMERFILLNHGEIKCETTITRVDPAKNLLVDSNGNAYRYKKLVWAADLKTLYRVINLEALTDSKVVKKIQAKQQAVSTKIGGDSVFTLYLTINLDKAYFAKISNPHFFYTPSVSGLSNVKINELFAPDRDGSLKFIDDKQRITAWLKRFIEFNTFEVSCPVLRDESLAPPGKTGLIVSVLFDYSLTRHIQAMGWYAEFKELMTAGMIDVLDASIYPGLKAVVIDSFTSTPLTMERISGNSDGAITGWAFTNDFIPAVNKMIKIASSVLTPIPDTYQAGQWTYSPAGLPISILTGKLAADKVLKDLA
jgi:phytoene dehydrogenase-like protein